MIEKISKIFSSMATDGHIPSGVFIFSVGSLIHYLHGLSADYVAFTTTILAFLGGHAWTQAKYPGPTDPQVPPQA